MDKKELKERNTKWQRDYRARLREHKPRLAKVGRRVYMEIQTAIEVLKEIQMDRDYPENQHEYKALKLALHALKEKLNEK